MPEYGTQPRRATQSLIGTIHYCVRHPSPLACELLWRWAFGIPALWLVLQQADRVYALVPPDALLRLEAVAYDPVQAASILFVLGQTLLPPVVQILEWLVPVLLAAWIVASGIGRWFVFRRLSKIRPELVPLAPPFRQAFRIAGFQAARVLGLTATCVVAWLLVRVTSVSAFADPKNPNLVFFLSAFVFISLGTFTAWAVVSWTVTVAPLIVARENRGFLAAARESLRLGRRLRNKLIEINLVLGIVKLASLVLEMVFSAVPLPFESATTPEQLHIWWACVAVGYFVLNDFFQVVRLVAMLETLENAAPRALH